MELLHEHIEKDILWEELTPDKFLRNTRYGGNQIYTFDYKDSPNLMLEVAMLRELSYRHAGGGTGKKNDLDHFDVRQHPFHQLIVWSPDNEDIIGGYRFSVCADRISFASQPNGSPFAEHFKLSPQFIKNYLPYSIELGRAWIQPKYQAAHKDGKNSIFALDNLWDGLGALINKYPEVKYLFGKMTIYPDYKPAARNLLLWFLDNYFGDHKNLVVPLRPVTRNYSIVSQIPFDGNNMKYDYNLLIRILKSIDAPIPPLINVYINLSDNIKITGSTFNPFFGNVYETGIIIKISDIYPEKLNRYAGTRKEFQPALSEYEL